MDGNCNFGLHDSKANKRKVFTCAFFVCLCFSVNRSIIMIGGLGVWWRKGVKWGLSPVQWSLRAPVNYKNREWDRTALAPGNSQSYEPISAALCCFCCVKHTYTQCITSYSSIQKLAVSRDCFWKKLIFVFRKDAFNWLQVTAKTFMMLKTI